MELQIENVKNRFIVKEALVFTVRIRNSGTSLLETPSITDNRNVEISYDLHGPSVGDGLKFQYGSAAEFRLPGDPELIAVDPGEAQEATVDIVNFVGEWKPGRHEIVVSWKDRTSEPFEFTIESPQVSSAQVLGDGWSSRQRNLRIAFVADEGDLYQGFYSEPDGTAETPATSRFVHAVKAPSGAEQVLVPWTNFDRGSVRFSRFGWIGRGRVALLEAGEDSPVEMELAGGHVLGPALMVKSGEVSLFLVNGTRLSMARLPRSGEGNPAEAWAVELPQEPAAGNSALGPEVGGSRPGAVVVMQDGDDISLGVAIDGKLRSQRVEQAKVLSGSQPALWIDPEGGLRAMVMVVPPSADDRVQLVEAVWKADETGAGIDRGPAVKIEGKVIGASAVYAPGADTPRRDWVVTTEDGKVVSSRAPSESRRYGSSPVLPLQLAARATETYLLVHHPTDLLALRLLR